ncbi:MAG: hypothetical protein PHD81_03335 [Candidatus Nanoarchaeia archaeon]|nr:hypothetical protein [Candidatus Nanoarchaeia archaeon]MDD5588118.1 hypothetical protein [Candidatus Nanoarchaeia archaeon]
MENNFCPNGIYFEKSKQIRCLFNHPNCNYKDFRECHFYLKRTEKPITNIQRNAYLASKPGSA